MRRVVLFLIALVWTANATAATYYVSAGQGGTPSGDDARSCMTAQTITTPKRSIGSGLGCLSAGDVLLVRGGTYNESLSNPTVASGSSWSSFVRVAAYTGETVTLQPTVGTNVLTFTTGNHSYIEFDGLNLDGSLLGSYEGVVAIFGASGADNHHIRIQNAELTGKANTHAYGVVFAGGGPGGDQTYARGLEFLSLVIHGGGTSDLDHGMYLPGSDVLVDGCEVYDFFGAGIQVYQNSNPNGQTGAVIKNNRIHTPQSSANARHWGIIEGTTGGLVFNNVIYDITDNGNQAAGIDAFGSSGGGYYNNTVYGAKRGIDLDGAASPVVRNNVLYGNVTNYTVNGGSSITEDHNARDGTDPHFADLAARDFQLTVASTVALDQGTTVASVPNDIAGVVRPQGNAYDIGAYEYTGVPNPPMPPPTTEPQRYRLRFRTP